MNDLGSKYFSTHRGEQFDEAINLIYELKEKDSHFRGAFLTTDSTVLNNISNPGVGDYAYLGTSWNAMAIYTYNTSWTSTLVTIDLIQSGVPVQTRGTSLSLTMSQNAITKNLFGIEQNTGISNVIFKVFPNFSELKTYKKDSFVTYNDLIYRCISPITSVGSWTGETNWAQSNIIEYILSRYNDQYTVFYDEHIPNDSNTPISTWQSVDYYNHLGDWFYNTSEGISDEDRVYHFEYDSEKTIYHWVKITDSDIILLLKELYSS